MKNVDPTFHIILSCDVISNQGLGERTKDFCFLLVFVFVVCWFATLSYYHIDIGDTTWRTIITPVSRPQSGPDDGYVEDFLWR